MPDQAQAHTGSYYAATVNSISDYAPLGGSQSADVCVIGAGFTGISTALHLAERGYNVHVVEANKVGWGATGRNGGQIIGGISGEEKIARHLGQDGERIMWEMHWAGNDPEPVTDFIGVGPSGLCRVRQQSLECG